MAQFAPNRLPALLVLAIVWLGACSDEPAAPTNAVGSDTVQQAMPSTSGSDELNLTVDHDALWAADQNRDEVDTSERQDLPDLVGADDDKRLAIDGRVLTREEVTRMRDRLDGAELSIELKTD